MLFKKDITELQAGTIEWNRARLGLMTSSNIHLIMGAKGIGKAGTDYIYKKVGESITGRTDDKEYGFVEQLDYGLKTEHEAVQEFARDKGWEYVICQKTIFNAGTLFASTPDGIYATESEEFNGYIVETLEVKCPFKHHVYIQQRLCETPQDLKRHFPEYYWQVIDQMLVCGANVGHFFTYHPDFPAGNRGHSIQFRKIPLYDEFNLLMARKKEAETVFHNIKSKLCDNQ